MKYPCRLVSVILIVFMSEAWANMDVWHRGQGHGLKVLSRRTSPRTLHSSGEDSQASSQRLRPKPRDSTRNKRKPHRLASSNTVDKDFTLRPIGRDQHLPKDLLTNSSGSRPTQTDSKSSISSSTEPQPRKRSRSSLLESSRKNPKTLKVESSPPRKQMIKSVPNASSPSLRAWLKQAGPDSPSEEVEGKEDFEPMLMAINETL